MGDPREQTETETAEADGLPRVVPTQALEVGARSLVADGRLRYDVLTVIGQGGFGRVYSVADHDLARVVALKVVSHTTDEGMAELLAEARITAALDHPGVVPIYDIGRTASGEPFFTMRQVSGQSLAGICDGGAGAAPVVTINDRLTILLKLCDVLAAAHHQGVLHCDIKPGNIMLGTFGEVLLVDWGIAASLAHGSASGDRRGTPAYMSPEQARGETLSVRSDIYALGATMFDLFAGRPPILADGSEAFWERKRHGELDQPTEAEQARIPRKLLAIALKALAADPAGRYAGIEALADDLRRFQAGQSVSACRDSLEERAGRWWRANRRGVGLSTALLLVVIGVGAYLYGERLKGIATWGSARWSPSLAAGRWQHEWTLAHGSVRQDGDGLVTTDVNDTVLFLNQRMTGPSALEFTGRMLPEGGPCDLSVDWYPEVVTGADGVPDLTRTKEGWRFQVGAFDNLYCGIIGPSPNGRTVRYRSLELNRDYRIRAEVDERRLALYIDGDLVCEQFSILPFSSGHFAFYGYHKGKRFSDVQVYAKGVPERLAPTAIGDAFADKGQWAAAAEQYARVAASLAGRPVAEEACYRQGICHLQAGDLAGAERVWQPLLASPQFAMRVRARLLEQRSTHATGALIEPLRQLCREARGDDRLLVMQAWCSGARALCSQGADPALMAAWLAVRDEQLADADTVIEDTANLLLSLRRPDEVLKRFPAQRWACADALLQLGDYDRILREYPDMVVQRTNALTRLGDYAATMTASGPTPMQRSWSWSDFGRYDELLAHRDEVRIEALNCALLDLDRPLEVLPRATGDEQRRVLLMLGRFDELQALQDPFYSALVLLHTGQAAAAERRWPGLAQVVSRARAVRALERLQAGEALAPEALAPPFATTDDLGPAYGMWQYLLVPFIRDTQGETGVFDAACRTARQELRQRYSQTVWYDAGYILGEVDRTTYKAQPMQRYLTRRLLLLDGLRAERAGRRDEAQRCYAAWAGPYPLGNDPVLSAFVRWRLAMLAK